MKTVNTKMRIHIESLYGDLLPKLREDLCKHCNPPFGWVCISLLPITSHGELCPYFNLNNQGELI